MGSKSAIEEKDIADAGKEIKEFDSADSELSVDQANDLQDELGSDIS